MVVRIARVPWLFLWLAVTLPPGEMVLHEPIVIPEGSVGYVLSGRNTSLRAASDFKGRALIVAKRTKSLQIRGITLDGNRKALAKPSGLPPYNKTFAEFSSGNGILIEDADDVRIQHLAFREIAGFAVLVSRSRDVLVESVQVRDSGSRNDRGRNNATGGVLLEDGTSRFTVRASLFQRILGNGVWTHSRYTATRNGPGVIERNEFTEIGRDAIQVGHATKVNVLHNRGRRIGYPAGAVDVEGGGIPVAIDTAGNVDDSNYRVNEFDDINGKCIDLDGFHDGEVFENVCRGVGHYAIVFNNTNPDMQSRNIRVVRNVVDGAKYGAVFLIGERHTVRGNQFRRLNLARCTSTKPGCVYLEGEAELLESGIYLGRKAERPDIARRNVITGNIISGYQIAKHCIVAAPGVSLKEQTITGNTCRNTAK